MKKEIYPTLTLAKLYEEQKKYVEAYAIYKYLSKKNKSSNLIKKSIQNRNRVFSDKNISYEPVIKKIFSKQDLSTLSIIPNSEYKKYNSLFFNNDADYQDDELEDNTIDENVLTENTEDLSIEFDADIPPLSSFEKIEPPSLGSNYENEKESHKENLLLEKEKLYEQLEQRLEKHKNTTLISFIEKILKNSDDKSFEDLTLNDFLQVISKL